MELKYLPNDQKDSIDANGNRFWSGNKLYPTPLSIQLDVQNLFSMFTQNSLEYDFVYYASLLKASTCGLSPSITRSQIEQYFLLLY